MLWLLLACSGSSTGMRVPEAQLPGLVYSAPSLMARTMVEALAHHPLGPAGIAVPCIDSGTVTLTGTLAGSPAAFDFSGTARFDDCTAAQIRASGAVNATLHRQGDAYDLTLRGDLTFPLGNSVVSISLDPLRVIARGWRVCSTAEVGPVDDRQAVSESCREPDTIYWPERAAALSVPRDGACVVAANGKVVAVGGATAGGTGYVYSDAVDVYDPEAGTSAHARLPSPRSGMGCAAIGSTVYVLGGYGPGSEGATTSVFVIDTKAELSVTRADWELAVPTSQAAVATCGTQIIVVGGDASPERALDEVTVHDTATGQTTRSKLPQPLVSVSAVAVGNKALFAGGASPPDFAASDRIEIYDCVANSWSRAMLPYPTTLLQGVALGTTAYFLNLNSFTDGPPQYMHVIDVATDTATTELLTLPPGLNDAVAAASGYLFIGGERNPPGTVLVFDPISNIWGRLQLKSPRSRHGAVGIGNRVFFVGGSREFFAFASPAIEEFTIP